MDVLFDPQSSPFEISDPRSQISELLVVSFLLRGLRSFLRCGLFVSCFRSFLLRCRAFRTRSGSGATAFAVFALGKFLRLLLGAVRIRLAGFAGFRPRVVAQRDRDVTEVSLLAVGASL